MLQGKTYANAGIGYTGAASLATAGVGNAGTVIASTVSNWGTMYDASHINLIGDPYVFGQNLLNQGLGNYGNLSAQLTAAGLDVTDITKVPATVSTTTQVSSQLTVSTSVGQVLFPTHTNVTTTNTVTASSPDVVLAIYKSITGNDLASIVSATQFTAPVTSLKTLADFLDFTKVLPLAQQSTYIQLGITDLDSLGAYIHNVIGQGYFNGWQDIASTLGKITVPQFSANNTTSGNSALLSGATVSTLSNYISYGSGVFNNPIMSDYLGAAAGMPYTANYNALIKAYYTIAPTIVVTALNTLQTTVTSYLAASSGAKAGLVSSLTSQVSAVNSALNSLSNTATYYGANVAYYSVMNKLSSEVSNLASAHVTFGTGTANGLFAFAQNIGTQFNDNVQIQTTQVMANLITNDSYGDTIRAAIAETDNISVLSSKGILTNNDPNPSRALQLATQQNIPISTYLMLNK